MSLQSSSTLAEKAILVEGTCCLVTGERLLGLPAVVGSFGATFDGASVVPRFWKTREAGSFPFFFFLPALGRVLTFRGAF